MPGDRYTTVTCLRCGHAILPQPSRYGLVGCGCGAVAVDHNRDGSVGRFLGDPTDYVRTPASVAQLAQVASDTQITLLAQAKALEAKGLSPAEVARALAPLRSFLAGIEEERDT